ncbi:MAG: tetratricopeptide repeat protein, partial [Alphaproteobacteria bacterium]
MGMIVLLRSVTRRVFLLKAILLAGLLAVCWPVTASAQFTKEELERNPHLTPALRKLILAYENYIKLFPNSERAKQFLIDEGGRFRDAGDHETAIKVFLRVLARSDLTQEDRAYAYEQIMDAYRSLGQFEKQLEWAHRMAVADVGAEKQQQAKDFIFAAGYNIAKALEDSGLYEQAAEAYERLAVKNPDHDQAPEAMLKAAQMYEEAGNKARAALTYERFYYTYPDYRDPVTGKGALLALETAAAIYADMNDYRHTADAIERILAAAPNHPERKKYLQNLAAIYSLLKDYNNAIRVRREFITAYPRDRLAGSYQWDIAQYRGLVGQRRQQLAEYEAFVRNYPNDFRAIEANYHIGEDRLRKRERALMRGNVAEAERLLQEARRYFERAYTLHDSLEQVGGRGAGDLRHALQAIIEVAKMDSARYYSISLSNVETFSRDSTEKWEALRQTERIYRKIANYAYPPTTFEALYKRGRLFEDFADEYLKQPRPDTAITYDQIQQVFFINAVSQTILEKLAIPAYKRQMIEFYEENKATIDTAAFTIPEPSLRRMHLYWLDRARERLEKIPAKIDSLRLNTIKYEADLLVLNAQEQIPKRFEEAWKQFAEEHRDRYRQEPVLVYIDKQRVFDIGVAPVVYGKGPDDTTAMVPRFQKIIAEGAPLGEDWVLYNRGRLRLVYAARSNYFKIVADEGVTQGLAAQLGSLRIESEKLVSIISSLPKLDLSALGPPPRKPDLTPPTPPQRPPGPPNTWPREVAIKFINDYKAYVEAVKNLRRRVQRYRRAVERYKRRREELIRRQTEAYRDVLQTAREEAQNFAREIIATQRYRAAIERVINSAIEALERDIAFGDSVGYSEQDMRAVRDSALSYAMHAAEQVDSLYKSLLEIRHKYEAQRDTASGGEGTPAFQVLNNLVTGYASVADS